MNEVEANQATQTAQATRKAQIEADTAKRIAAGETPSTSADATDRATIRDTQTGSEFQVPLSALGGGAGAEGDGTLGNPIIYDPVKWLWMSRTPLATGGIVGTQGDETYADGVVTAMGSGEVLNGAIPTPVVNAPGVVPTAAPVGSADSVADGVQVGDRVYYYDDSWGHNGIYTVTSLGSVSSPWVLTRAADMPESDVLLAFYLEVEGTIISIRTVAEQDDPIYPQPAIVTAPQAVALGQDSVASGLGSVALSGGIARGRHSTALGGYASGNSSVAIKGTATGSGAVSLYSGDQSGITSIGLGSGDNAAAAVIRIGGSGKGAIIENKVGPGGLAANENGDVFLDFDVATFFDLALVEDVTITPTIIPGGYSLRSGMVGRVLVRNEQGQPFDVALGFAWVETFTPKTFAPNSAALLTVCRFTYGTVATWVDLVSS